MSNYVNQSKARLIDLMLFFAFFQRIIGKRWVSRWTKNYTLAEQELSILPKILKRDSIIFDIGANRGELSFFFAVTCNFKKVFAFEPQSRMFGILGGVADNITNIIPINTALSDSAEKKILKIPIKSTGQYTPAASFEQVHDNNLKKEKVEVDTLDNFVAKNNIPAVNFIKCDTEGHELSVFRGAKKTLETLRPILYIEITNPNEHLLFDLLSHAGYRPYQWDNLSLCFVPRIDRKNTPSENYYFVPIEKEKKIAEALKDI
ncbi:hypothetical protein COB55_00220 [Candidatus Wolfebacteria bacterium]|nr:MAG: hypothetical protein COB55_00220 [Candidatus Wolfebacteria bacterium]